MYIYHICVLVFLLLIYMLIIIQNKVTELISNEQLKTNNYNTITLFL